MRRPSKRDANHLFTQARFVMVHEAPRNVVLGQHRCHIACPAATARLVAVVAAGFPGNSLSACACRVPIVITLSPPLPLILLCYLSLLISNSPSLSVPFSFFVCFHAEEYRYSFSLQSISLSFSPMVADNPLPHSAFVGEGLGEREKGDSGTNGASVIFML